LNTPSSFAPCWIWHCEVVAQVSKFVWRDVIGCNTNALGLSFSYLRFAFIISNGLGCAFRWAAGSDQSRGSSRL
jgi:hypothetical protein